MHTALAFQTVEIHLPSGNTLTVNAEVLAKRLASSLNKHGEALAPTASFMGYVKNPGQMLQDAFKMSLAEIYTFRTSVSGEGPTNGDHSAWVAVGRAPLGTIQCPFSLHITGLDPVAREAATEALNLSAEQTQDLFNGIQRALDVLAMGHNLRAIALLDGVMIGLKSIAQPPARPVYNDGWGHTTENASVEDLLKEGEAALQGTDKHEQVIQKLLGEDNTKGAVEMLLGAIKGQGALIRQLQEGRIKHLQRLNELGKWLQAELMGAENSASRDRTMRAFAQQLSQLGIEPADQGAAHPSQQS